jgi:hypothetical protein
VRGDVDVCIAGMVTMAPHKVRRRARTCHIRPSPVGHPS